MAKTDIGPAIGKQASTLMVRLDKASKQTLAQAAELRQVSVSDYVRQVMVSQARREVAAARRSAIVLTPDEQLAFWNALQGPPMLTKSQRRLGKLMRGEA